MSVNWHDQWAQFAENFYDGKAHISLGEKTLLLYPGPGFGDLSHPTTRLMIQMMKGKVKGESVIDIGCGSGILTLAALLMGASFAYGIDIDSEAIKHARKNAKLNHLTARFGKKVPKGSENSIFLMNMIASEQRVVRPETYQAKLWIVSGILASQEKDYLLETQKWGWRLLEKRKESGWCGFIFNLLDTAE